MKPVLSRSKGRLNLAPVIDISNATVIRGANRVLDGFTLQIEEGCSTAILGPNGAGKSTLLKLVSGELRQVHSGTSHVKVLGKEQWNVWDLRAHFGIVSYDLQHDYLASVTGLNVVLSGFYSSVDTWAHQTFTDAQRVRVDEVVRMLGIEGLKGRPFGSMSTGEQRRLLLARALVHDPDTLLLDEPAAGLDLKSSFQHRALLRELMQQGLTVLLITHNVQEILPEIHRVVMLKEGTVFADGSREDVLSSETLSALFDCPLHAVWFNGTCQVYPG